MSRPILSLLALSLLTLAPTACGRDVTTDDRVYAPVDDAIVDVGGEKPADEPPEGEDDEIVTPPDDDCGPGLCFSEEDAAALDANASALASCEAVEPHDFEDTGTVVISQLDLVEQEGGWALAVAIADPSGRGAYDYPGFAIETTGGAEVLLSSFEQEGAVAADYMEHQGYGVSGCDPFGATFPLALTDGEEVKLKVVAWHDLGDNIVDEITFSLRLP